MSTGRNGGRKPLSWRLARSETSFPSGGWHKGQGLWCKKHRGEFHYFGTDRDAALKRFVAEWHDIRAGRKHRPARDESAATLADVVNAFLTAKRERVSTGELT